MELSNRVMYRLVRDSKPGAWLVDLIPISEVLSKISILPFIDPIDKVRYIPDWFPGAYFKRYARKVRRELDEWATKPWELVKSHTV
jgi:hypothetical protein